MMEEAYVINLPLDSWLISQCWSWLRAVTDRCCRYVRYSEGEVAWSAPLEEADVEPMHNLLPCRYRAFKNEQTDAWRKAILST